MSLLLKKKGLEEEHLKGAPASKYTPILSSPQMNTSYPFMNQQSGRLIFALGEALERVFMRHLLFRWTVLGNKQWPGLCLTVGTLISSTRFLLVLRYYIIFFFVNKSSRKHNPNNELIIQTNTACRAKAWYTVAYYSVPQMSILVQKKIKTHSEGNRQPGLLHRAHKFSKKAFNTALLDYSSTTCVSTICLH